MHIVLALHNLLRWAVLFFGIWTLINALTGVIKKRTYSANDERSNLFFLICCDIQLLVGLSLYFFNPWFQMLRSKGGAVMKDTATRFFTVEHASMMIVAWILVHIGRSSVKKAATDAAKHRKMLLFFGVALLLIIAAIPWPFRKEIARPLFRGFN